MSLSFEQTDGNHAADKSYVVFISANDRNRLDSSLAFIDLDFELNDNNLIKFDSRELMEIQL